MLPVLLQQVETSACPTRRTCASSRDHVTECSFEALTFDSSARSIIHVLPLYLSHCSYPAAVRGIFNFKAESPERQANFRSQKFTEQDMEKTLGSTIEKFGGRVASVWRNLHPSTRGLMERALVSTGSTPAVAATRHNIPYTARAEQELSRLLAALDDRAAETGGGLTLKQKTQLDHMAET